MSKNNLILSSWVDEQSQVIGKETFNIIKALGDKKQVTGVFVAKVIEYLIEASVHDSLVNIQGEPQSDEDAYNLTKDSFTNLKINLQQGIAVGFERAIEEYSGRQLSYYCLIRPVPEPTNKLPI